MEPLTSQSRTSDRGRRDGARRRGSETTSPPVRTLWRSARRTSRREPAPRTQRRVRRSPGFHDEPREGVAREASSSAVNSAKSLRASVRRVAPRPQCAARLVVDIHDLAGGELLDCLCWPSPPAALSSPPRVPVPPSGTGSRDQRTVGLAPERIEGAIEDRQVVVAMDQQRPAGVVDLVCTPTSTCCRASVTSSMRPGCTSRPRRRSRRPKARRLSSSHGSPRRVTAPPLERGSRPAVRRGPPRCRRWP